MTIDPNRDYGKAHRRLRKLWGLRVAQGGVLCARCHLPIEPHTPWDLGHDDHDRTQYAGPEHRACNRSTAGRKHLMPRLQSRVW